MPSGRSEETLLRVRVQPRASRNEIVAWEGDALRMRVSAPPVDGEANLAVTKVLARALGVAPSTVNVVRGEHARDKVVRVAGLSLAAVRERLGAVAVALVFVLSITAPAAAEHLTADASARPLVPPAFVVPPLDADLNVKLDRDGFRIGGRLFGLGGWLQGRLLGNGFTLDGQLQGDRTYNFRLDAAPEGLRLHLTPGSI